MSETQILCLPEGITVTPKMAEAGKAKLIDLGFEGVEFTDAQRVFEDMLAAAPKPPTGLYEVREDGSVRRLEVDVIRFVKWIVEKSWDGCDVDGADIQDLAVKCGILAEVAFDPKQHDDPFCAAEPGDPWFVFSDGFRDLIGDDRHD